MMPENQRVAVYVDGFNVYDGLFRFEGARPSSEKWLNPAMLGNLICQERGLAGTVVLVRYCTSEVLPSLDEAGTIVARRPKEWRQFETELADAK